MRAKIPREICHECGGLRPVVKPTKVPRTEIRALVELYRLTIRSGDSWHHIGTFRQNRSGGGDFAKLRHEGWELAEQHINTDSRKRTSGIWRITDRGRDFVEGKISIPSHLDIWALSTVLGVSRGSRVVYIRDIGPEFNFDFEEMRRLARPFRLVGGGSGE
jgi:hypothetical protein